MNRFLFAIVLVVAPAALLCCAAPKEDDDDPAATFVHYKPLAAAIAKADKVVLYEGLPHQFFERKELEEELKAKKTIERHKYPFYAEPLELKAADAKELTRLSSDGKSLEAFGGFKLCGGFHPDYCIEFHVGKDLIHCLICLGCDEVKIYGLQKEVYCDMAGDADEEFAKVLKPYRKQRPKGKQ